MANDWQYRKQMADFGRRVHDRGLVAATDGNISVRLSPDRFLITPSGMSLGELEPADMVEIDRSGRKLAGGRKASSEYLLHLTVYELRRDVCAIVHAHPPVANGFTFAGVSLADCVVPEVVVTMGPIPTTAYATPSTAEGAVVVRDVISKHDAFMLERHGSVTVGADLRSAYHKLEKLEHTAQVLLTARTLGGVKALSAAELQKLGELRESLGLGCADDLLRACGRCGGK